MVGLLEVVCDDIKAFADRLHPHRPPQPGLHTYRIALDRGTRRMHLRIEEDGRGVLFVDVTDVVHLNPTAAEMAKWALDGVPRRVAEMRLLARHGRAGLTWQDDLDSIDAMISQFSRPDGKCPTCALSHIERTDLFSTPVHAPFKADLSLTYSCTNDCPHCYNERQRLDARPMPAGPWKQIIDRLCDAGVPHLIFTGGEPTLHDDLPELIQYADRRGAICGLNTNGRRLADMAFVERLVAAGLNHVQITLGSHLPEVHDRMMHARAFHQTVQGIHNSLACGLHTITNTTLMRMNGDLIEETVSFIYGLGIRTFAVNGMIYSGGGTETDQGIPEDKMAPLLTGIRDQAQELGMKFLWYTPTMYCRLSPVELEIGAKRCNAGEYTMCVEPNGDVLPCQSYYVTAGNLLRDRWEEIWNGQLFRGFRDRGLNPQKSGLPEICWDCPDLPLCGGGCPMEREAGCDSTFISSASLTATVGRRSTGMFERQWVVGSGQ